MVIQKMHQLKIVSINIRPLLLTCAKEIAVPLTLGILSLRLLP